MKILVVVKILKFHHENPSSPETCVSKASRSIETDSATPIVTSGIITSSGAR